MATTAPSCPSVPELGHGAPWLHSGRSGNPRYSRQRSVDQAPGVGEPVLHALTRLGLGAVNKAQKGSYSYLYEEYDM